MIKSILYIKSSYPKSVSKSIKKYSFFIDIQRIVYLIKQEESDWDMIIELVIKNEDDLQYICKQITKKTGALIDCKILSVR
ncbi:MAG TPA: hypothetical protein VFX18_06235 [Candidatus Nitrosocosmicus sp.]|nr:hypothetical protein [Candidatus Nitrosocosmicus sp.]